MRTLDELKKKRLEKADKLELPACLEAMQQQPNGTRDGKWASQDSSRLPLPPRKGARPCVKDPGYRRGVLKPNLNPGWLNFTRWSHFFPLCCLPPVLLACVLFPSVLVSAHQTLLEA